MIEREGGRERAFVLPSHFQCRSRVEYSRPPSLFLLSLLFHTFSRSRMHRLAVLPTERDAFWSLSLIPPLLTPPLPPSTHSTENRYAHTRLISPLSKSHWTNRTKKEKEKRERESCHPQRYHIFTSCFPFFFFFFFFFSFSSLFPYLLYCLVLDSTLAL